jgi:hypothetical protein
MNKKHLIIGFGLLAISIICCIIALCIELQQELNKFIAIFCIAILPLAEYELMKGVFDI